jgi:hypothetical protein
VNYRSNKYAKLKKGQNRPKITEKYEDEGHLMKKAIKRPSLLRARCVK